MDKHTFFTRSIAIMVFIALMMGLFGYSLYDFQIVHGAEALAMSDKKIASSDTVDSSRGEITDRYGRVLVTNSLCYNVTLDQLSMGGYQDQNKQILSLVNLCANKGVAYTDELPLSQEAPYDSVLSGETASQQKIFTSYLADRKINANGSGTALLSVLRTEYGIDPGYSDGDARKIAGIRYELDLRTRNIVNTAYVFAGNVNIDFITVLKETGYSGVRIETSTIRKYTTPYAAQLLGWVGQMNQDEWNAYKSKGYSMNALIGKDGVEKAFESYLHGSGGIRIVDSNTSGKVVDETYAVKPEPGDNVTLTLDLGLQESLETALDNYMKQKNKNHGAGAVIIDVHSGGVLAMASYPTYDLSTFSSNYSKLANQSPSPLFNRVTQGVYPPGSTFKMVTAVGGLQEGIITPSTRVLDTGRYAYYKDYQPMCWLYREYHRTHGWVNVSKALEVSCNVFFYDVGRRLTIQLLDKYASEFGLGQHTGIELPESVGALAGPENSKKIGQDWNEGTVLSAAIGQSDNSFTPLQLANYVATLVNGGTRYSVHVLQSVKSYDYSSIVYQHQNKVLNSIQISPQNLSAVKEGMLAVTQTGTAAAMFKGFPIKVGAKTGSAQVGENSDSNAVFVCFAPYDDPQIAMAFVAEKGGAGYELAQVARNVLDYYFGTPDTSSQIETENSLLP
ncbi:MAG: penicillin-binding transpeptidase domain-containing protein [Oscillospiraceae bacterium]|nr:penicillin-binding transpeptidase domain-containing protein [Oscillospiraceae bacterium]